MWPLKMMLEVDEIGGDVMMWPLKLIRQDGMS